MNPTLRWMLAGAAATAAAVAFGRESVDLPPNPGRDALRQIVQDQCLVDWSQHHDPAPCERVVLDGPNAGNAGYAVLPDRKGGAHYLLIPIPTMAGADARELLDPDTPNYFADAWRAREVIAHFVGHDVPRSAVGLAVNKMQSRSQNQFHIHIECLREDVYADLRAAADHVSETGSPVTVGGARYDAVRVLGEGLEGANPYDLLARLTPGARNHMGDYTVIVAGMQFTGGPGFIVLTGTGQSGELLLDSSCAVAGGGG